ARLARAPPLRVTGRACLGTRCVAAWASLREDTGVGVDRRRTRAGRAVAEPAVRVAAERVAAACGGVGHRVGPAPDAPGDVAELHGHGGGALGAGAVAERARAVVAPGARAAIGQQGEVVVRPGGGARPPGD